MLGCMRAQAPAPATPEVEEEKPAPKPKDPLASLPPSPMVLDSWKRLYSNTPAPRFKEVCVAGLWAGADIPNSPTNEARPLELFLFLFGLLFRVEPEHGPQRCVPCAKQQRVIAAHAALSAPAQAPAACCLSIGHSAACPAPSSSG
jgi:hypothetical protein